MGWGFNWVSAVGDDFNIDHHVYFPEAARKDGVFYNFETMPDPQTDELHGVSVFTRDEAGQIFRTYSSYGRGGEVFLPAYAWLDIAPKGRLEGDGGDMGRWMRRHDQYETDGRTRGPGLASAA
jgi:predicted dithiol-disulfide oxidoreductase (DUF899 family)